MEAGKPTESLPLRMLGKGDPKVTFVVGAVLSFPGVSYLDALDHIHKLNPGTVPTVLLVIGFCLMQQILLEVPLLGYVFAPEGTQDRINRFKAWMGRKGRPAATIGAAVIGVILVARGIITLIRPQSLARTTRLSAPSFSRVQSISSSSSAPCPSQIGGLKGCSIHPIWMTTCGVDRRSVGVGAQHEPEGRPEMERSQCLQVMRARRHRGFCSSISRTPSRA